MVGDWTDFWVPKPQALMVFTWLRDWEHRLDIQLELNWSSLALFSASVFLSEFVFPLFLSLVLSWYFFLPFTTSFGFFTPLSLLWFIFFSIKVHIFTLQNTWRKQMTETASAELNKIFFHFFQLSFSYLIKFIFLFDSNYWKLIRRLWNNLSAFVLTQKTFFCLISFHILFAC